MKHTETKFHQIISSEPDKLDLFIEMNSNFSAPYEAYIKLTYVAIKRTK
jgi:hypothetical protein